MQKIGEKDPALNCENKIVNDIPYADSPPGFKDRQILDILLTRIARRDAQHV